MALTFIKDTTQLKKLSAKYGFEFDKKYFYITKDPTDKVMDKMKDDGYKLQYIDGAFYPFLVKIGTKLKESRFNLWESVETNDKEELEKEVTDSEEVPEEEEVETEVDAEEEETLADLAINFVLALPEDLIPEDLKAAYDAVIDRAGDEYLLGDDEAEETDEESDDEDELEEAKKLEDITNPYEKGSIEYNTFEDMRKQSKGAIKIASLSSKTSDGKQGIKGTVATKYLELLGESKDMTGQQLASEVENVARKYFPESYVRSKFEQGLGNNQGLVALKFAIGKDKNEWTNGIIHNDPAHNSILIWGFDKDGNQKNELTMSSTTAGYSNWKTGVKGKAGWRDIKKGGTPSKILKALDNYFTQLKELADSDKHSIKESKNKEEDKIEDLRRKNNDEFAPKYSSKKLREIGADIRSGKISYKDGITKANEFGISAKIAKDHFDYWGIKEEVKESTESKRVIWKRLTVFDRL